MTDIMKLIARLREPECENHDVGATGVSVELLDWDVLDEAADAIEALQDEVEQVKGFWKEAQLRNRNLLEEGNDLAMLADQYKAERDKLQAKLDELQRQEPVAWMYTYTGKGGNGVKLLERRAEAPEGGWKDYEETPLYAAPKALEPLTAQAVPWKCINGEACKHGWWCSESYCQEHCVFRSPSMKGDP